MNTDALFRDIIAADPHFADFLRDMNRAQLDREEREAKADPVGHKLSKVFRDGLSYRFYGGRDGRGRQVRFCWSVHRNIAGYFLGWREVIAKDGSGKRDGWIANRRKATLIARADKLHDQLKARKK